MGDWKTATKTSEVINAASFDYGGFGLLLHNSSDVLAQTLSQVPYMEEKGTEVISAIAAKEGAQFLGFEHCQFVTSGYTMNLVAFPAIHEAAMARGHKTVFLMDSSSHNSMMIGSYISTGSKIIRFEHNNVDDLLAKLISASADKSAEIIVGIEGNYSMEGGLPPLPAIIAMKQKYNFKIYIDEAHSFLALGKTGRGIVEHYADLGYNISSKDVDCIGATMSKSVGTVGGMLVMHDREWYDAIASRLKVMDETGGGGSLPTVVKMRLLQIIRKPTLVAQRMSILRQHTVYILESLHKAGLCVHSDYMSPVIVVITVSLSGCARFGAECHRLGLAVTMAGPPATAAWRSVGRLCINALLSRTDVEQLVRIVVQSAVNVGVVGPKAVKIANALKYDFKQDDSKDALIAIESLRVDKDLIALLRRQQLANMNNKVAKHSDTVLAHGVKILHSQGLGATSNRLYWGSLLAHVQCEHKLTTMYPSLTHYVPGGKVMALIMTEARTTISSTLASCISPLAKKSVLHLVLIPVNASMPVYEAIKSTKVSPRVKICFYNDLQNMHDQLTEHVVKKTYVTMYLPTLDPNGTTLDLAKVFATLTSTHVWRRFVTGYQLVLDDSLGFGHIGPHGLGYLDHLSHLNGTDQIATLLHSLAVPTRFYLLGSFYHAFKLQGGFVLAARDLVRLLHWTSRASMFATAPLPCNVGMAQKMIEELMLPRTTTLAPAGKGLGTGVGTDGTYTCASDAVSLTGSTAIGKRLAMLREEEAGSGHGGGTGSDGLQRPLVRSDSIESTVALLAV